MSETVRVVCTVPNASTCISDVRFAELKPASNLAPATLLSEPVDAEVAEHFCRSAGFALFDPATTPKRDVASVDEAIALARAAADKVAQGGDAGNLARTVEELQRANQSISGDCQRLREERDAAVQRLADSSVPKLEAEVAKLAADVVEREGTIRDLEGQLAEAKRVNAELGKPAKGKAEKDETKAA